MDHMQTLQKLVALGERKALLTRQLEEVNTEIRALVPEILNGTAAPAPTPEPSTPLSPSERMKKLWATMAPEKRRRWVRNIRKHAVPAMQAGLRQRRAAAARQAKG